MSLSNQSHRKVFERFDTLRDLPVDARNKAISDDPTLTDEERKALRSLLDHDAPTDRFLGAPVGDATASLIEPLADEPAPETLGDHRVLRRIGRGSFGNVYLAEQQHPKRLVAIKVLSGRVPRTELRRLEFEAEALARLNHPNITSVLSLGREGDRRFLVMEYVDGLPLDQFLLLHNPDRIERLRLLAGICDGVEHAHRRGVLHRDLAPKNILVTHARVAKILDFGLAREIGARMQATQRLTLPGSVIGTLRYMSPEQLDGDPDQVDTRSDIYSLGVIIFESISGRHPYIEEQTTLGDAINRLRSAEPARPDPDDRHRHTSDLRAVLLKAIERDPQRRYASAADLGRDLRNLIANRPVSAHPASVLYRASKFARRNRAFTAALSAGLLIGAAAITSSAITLKREAQSRDSAINALSAVITRLLSPLAPRIGTLEERDTLLGEIEADIVSMHTRTPDDPRVVELFASFQLARADIRRERDLPAAALAAYRRAVPAYAHLWELSSGDARVGHAYSLALVKQGDSEIASGNENTGRALYREALALDESLAERDPEDTGVLSNLFWSYWRVATLPETTPEQFTEYDQRIASLADRMIAQDPDDWRSIEAMSHVAFRKIKHDQPGPETYEAMADAVAWAERLVATNPESVIHNTKLLTALASVLDIPEPGVSAADRERYLARARQIENSLSSNQGELRLEDNVLSQINVQLCSDALRDSRFKEAEEFAERSLAYQRRRLASSIGSPDLSRHMCSTLINLYFPAKRGADPEWSPEREQAILDQLAAEVLERFPDHPGAEAAAAAIRASRTD